MKTGRKKKDLVSLPVSRKNSLKENKLHNLQKKCANDQ